MGKLTPIHLCNSPADDWDGDGDVQWCLGPAIRWWIRPVTEQRGLLCSCEKHKEIWERFQLPEITHEEAVAHCVLNEWDS